MILKYFFSYCIILKKEFIMKKLKIVGTVFYSIITVPLLIILFTSIPSLAGPNDGWNALGGVILMVYTSLIAFALYLVPIILGIIGLCKNKKSQDQSKTKCNKIYFIFMIVLPVFTTLVNFFVYYILLLN